MELPNDVLGERGADAARLSLKPYKRAACQVEEASILGRGDFEKFHEKFRPSGIWQR